MSDSWSETPPEESVGFASELRELAHAPPVPLEHLREQATLPAGSVVDGTFVVERVLGTGGMGVVYLARHEALDRRVALKLCLRRSSERHTQLLLREARTMAALVHPHVVAVHHVGTAAEQVYIAMEYVPGGRPARLLHRRRARRRARRAGVGAPDRGGVERLGELAVLEAMSLYGARPHAPAAATDEPRTQHAAWAETERAVRLCEHIGCEPALAGRLGFARARLLVARDEHEAGAALARETLANLRGERRTIRELRDEISRSRPSEIPTAACGSRPPPACARGSPLRPPAPCSAPSPTRTPRSPRAR